MHADTEIYSRIYNSKLLKKNKSIESRTSAFNMSLLLADSKILRKNNTSGNGDNGIFRRR